MIKNIFKKFFRVIILLERRKASADACAPADYSDAVGAMIAHYWRQPPVPHAIKRRAAGSLR